jgi:hypothetical protein
MVKFETGLQQQKNKEQKQTNQTNEQTNKQKHKIYYTRHISSG